MNEEDYTIDNLIEVFKEHSREASMKLDYWIEEFRQDHPEQDLPGWMKERFLVSSALLIVCKEIQALKKKD